MTYTDVFLAQPIWALQPAFLWSWTSQFKADCSTRVLESQWLNTLKVSFSFLSQFDVGSIVVFYLVLLSVLNLHLEYML
jgi:hypothetical protein